MTNEEFRWSLSDFPKIMQQVSDQHEFAAKLPWFQTQAPFGQNEFIHRTVPVISLWVTVSWTIFYFRAIYSSDENAALPESSAGRWVRSVSNGVELAQCPFLHVGGPQRTVTPEVTREQWRRALGLSWNKEGPQLGSSRGPHGQSRWRKWVTGHSEKRVILLYKHFPAWVFALFPPRHCYVFCVTVILWTCETSDNL